MNLTKWVYGLVLVLVAMGSTYGSLGQAPKAILMVAYLAAWISVLERLRETTRRPLPSQWILAGVAYLGFYGVSLLVHGASLRYDLPTALAGLLLFLYTLTLDSRRLPTDFLVLAFVALGTLHGLLTVFQFVAPGAFSAIFSRFLGTAFDVATSYISEGRATGIWQDSVRLGTLLAVSLPFTLIAARRGRRWAWFSFVIVCIATLLTFSRAPIFVALLGLVVLSWSSLARVHAKLAPLLVVALLVGLTTQIASTTAVTERLYSSRTYSADFQENGPAANRAKVYSALLPHAFDEPALGMGDRYRDFLPRGFTSAHNSLLQSLIAFGLPATVCLVTIVFGAGFLVARRRRCRDVDVATAAYLGAVSVVAIGLAHGVVFDWQFNVLMWICLGICVRICTNRMATVRGDPDV